MTAMAHENTVSSGHVLTCLDVDARYNQVSVVKGVSLGVKAGETLAVLGPNGAGKSSLLGAIAGIVSNSGKVLSGNDDVSSLPVHVRAKKGLAFVPEQRGNIFSILSVRENIEIGLRLLPVEERDAQRAYLLDLFPILASRGDAPAGVLSGGEQQMLAIGIALARKPSVLLLDEPTQGLAPTVFDILEKVFGVLRSSGIGLLLAEQNVPFAARVADRYAVLSQGRIVDEGDKEKLKYPDQIADSFLALGG